MKGDDYHVGNGHKFRKELVDGRDFQGPEYLLLLFFA